MADKSWDVDGFKARFPEFDKTADALIKRAATIYDELYKAAFEGLRVQCEDYFVAHWLTIEDSDDVETSGVVTSKTVGPVSLGYASGASMPKYGAYGSTKYGRRFVELGSTFDMAVYIA
ncbi:DUF4054 domain-containing protein [Thiolapillus sp.]|uniref:DUF4054 domain-containing protein n=1 Tax=Thiolapillus sp. TaxID=2017437 RepID=UPI003AF6D4DA